jgi:pimeloyl-ACP methyl ester carboxylesterase
MKRIYQSLFGLLLALTLAIAPTLPLWSQTPKLIGSSQPTAIAKNGTYQSVACAMLTAPPVGADRVGSKSPFPPEAVEGKDYECGYLTVPELHSQPDGKTIQVGIAILKSTRSDPAEPLIMFQGGPGGSSIDIFPGLMLNSALSKKLRSQRDLIVFEKRGNRYSRPHLPCPEYKEDNVNFDQAAVSKTLEGLKACRDRLVKAGVNLAAFNSIESAHDVAALVQALGYKQVNLYGVSYGTELAQDVLSLHPALVRSVILDGVVPNEPSIDSQYAIILNRLIT